MNVAVLFSGGKDSTYATWVVQHQGWDVTALLTVRPSATDSLMFHYPNVEWTLFQTEAMGLPHQFVDVAAKDEMEGLAQALIAMRTARGVSGLVNGAVASDFQKDKLHNMYDAIG